MASGHLLLFAVSIGLVALSYSYPSGAPQETCNIFTANHTGHLPQRTKAKYDIFVSPASVKAGDKAIVTIQGAGGESFKGFFIQGQDEINRQPMGKFRSQADAQTRDCSGPGSSNAATHVDSSDKSKITLEWTAPAQKGKVMFRAVIVKTYELFWDNLYSNSVTVV